MVRDHRHRRDLEPREIGEAASSEGSRRGVAGAGAAGAGHRGAPGAACPVCGQRGAGRAAGARTAAGGRSASRQAARAAAPGTSAAASRSARNGTGLCSAGHLVHAGAARQHAAAARPRRSGAPRAGRSPVRFLARRPAIDRRLGGSGKAPSASRRILTAWLPKRSNDPSTCAASPTGSGSLESTMGTSAR